ncbi:Antitoxin VapB1 (plasmid) [Phaeobacter piscinae]|uniref:Antitoxin VapB1 n=1 Tax=Phaeobacter piscinae TaxID=1580596 RepID=A0ABN5DNL4_9RHOB|nr:MULTISPECIES: type II toxin-antitoxin system VapB family antitoxin [Phaeobacter]ATG38113.1 Antitoxin VapB1 [Phaeobacter piscinae]AUQ88634.1 Antitoxin VapB1 [Phaeobacter piscinae]AUQ92633.1 Antitoxin VapB1 [Phaeobacter inhibens]AUR26439.1 Antitoxin VapB1 [Phaeobacter piscinae]
MTPTPEPSTAKVFMTGRSQAVRLPKDFRFDTDEVRIRAEGGKVILEPIEEGWGWLNELHALGPLDQDAVDAATEEVQEQTRPELDVFE